MFEKSESDNTLLFTVVQAIVLLIDASLESGVSKRVAECWALRPIGECIIQRYNVQLPPPKLRLRNDLYCIERGVKLYSLTHASETI